MPIWLSVLEVIYSIHIMLSAAVNKKKRSCEHKNQNISGLLNWKGEI